MNVADWLADAGLRNLPLEEMVDGFARRLEESGVPVARIFVGPARGIPWCGRAV